MEKRYPEGIVDRPEKNMIPIAAKRKEWERPVPRGTKT